MYKTSRSKRKPDFILLLTIFVCLGVVLTTTVSAAEPETKGWGIHMSAESGCDAATGEWQTCSHWQQGLNDFKAGEALAPRRAALRLTSDYMPDTSLVTYYTLSDTRQFEGGDAELRFINKQSELASGYDSRQFGMALKQQYGSFGMSVGFEATKVEDLVDDPLFYVGGSFSW